MKKLLLFSIAFVGAQLINADCDQATKKSRSMANEYFACLDKAADMVKAKKKPVTCNKKRDAYHAADQAMRRICTDYFTPSGAVKKVELID